MGPDKDPRDVKRYAGRPLPVCRIARTAVSDWTVPSTFIDYLQTSPVHDWAHITGRCAGTNGRGECPVNAAQQFSQHFPRVAQYLVVHRGVAHGTLPHGVGARGARCGPAEPAEMTPRAAAPR
eukprot:6784056-Prymnesium_polylepis.1